MESKDCNLGGKGTLRRCVAALALLGSGAHAAEPGASDLIGMPLEELLNIQVYSASRYVQQVADAPSAVSIVTSDEIRAHGWRTLADVLRSLRGLNVNEDRNYSYLGSRGFLRPGDFNERYLVLVDGMRINDTVHDRAPIGHDFPLDLELIDRVEFVRGPGSSVYGSSAFFGVINVITRRGTEGLHATLEAGHQGMRRGAVQAGWRDGGGRRYLLGASSYRADGRDLYFPEFAGWDGSAGTAEGMDGERAQRAYFKLAAGALQASLVHATRRKDIPTASYWQPFNDNRTHTVDAQSYANLQWSHKAGAAEELSLRLFAAEYDTAGTYIYADGSERLFRDTSLGRWWGTELKLVSQRFAGHMLVAGLEFHRDHLLEQRNYDLDPYASYLYDQRSGTRIGAYLQDEWRVHQRVTVNAGVRVDRNFGADNAASPRLALILHPAAGVTVKAIHGSAYRMPNSHEKYYEYAGPGGQLANPALGRERIRSTELLLAWQHGGGRLVGNLYRNKVRGLIGQLRDPYTFLPQFQNADRVTVRGAELEYEYRFSGGAQLRASASRTLASSVNAPPTENIMSATLFAPRPDEGPPVTAPDRMAKVNFTTGAWRRWRAALEVQYYGPRNTLRGRVGGYTLVNANLLSAKLWPDTEVAIGAYNLFDKRYADPGSFEHVQDAIVQDGRTLRIRLTHSF